MYIKRENILLLYKMFMSVAFELAMEGSFFKYRGHVTLKIG